MSALGPVLAILRDPTVRAIVLPLAREVVAWVRGGNRPKWLDGALREVPELRSPAALADAVAQRAALDKAAKRR